MSIHERISCLRKEKALTQEQLGALLGISGQAVSKWEKGESMPDIMLLPDLCAALNTSTDYLLGTTSERHYALPSYSDCKGLDTEVISFFLRILADEGCIEILDCISETDSITRDEIMERTQKDYDTVTRVLHGFAKRNIVKCGYNGYTLGIGAKGVRLILAGCSLLHHEMS